MYDKTTIHSILLGLCILAYLVSPKTDMTIPIQEVQASQAPQKGEIWEVSVPTQTGEVERQLESPIQDAKQGNWKEKGLENSRKELLTWTWYWYTSPWDKNEWILNDSEVKRGQMECDATCKVNTLVSLGIEPRIAGSLVFSCKDKALDPRHCVIAWASIVKNESSGGKRCKNNNCFWIGGGKVKYDTVEKWVEDWVARYIKWWHKAQSASFFYPAKWQVSRSKYCTSEYSSDSSVWCPNGLRISQDFWNKLDKLF